MVIDFEFNIKSVFQIQEMKSWLHECQCMETVPPQELVLMLTEIENNKIGIWAGNMFVITYRIIYQYLLVIMTFSIVCVVENTRV